MNSPEECFSAGNYKLIDKESTRGVFFRRELQYYRQGIHHAEYGYSAENYKLMDKESTMQSMVFPPGITSL
jgi:hypothetical protein